MGTKQLQAPEIAPIQREVLSQMVRRRPAATQLSRHALSEQPWSIHRETVLAPVGFRCYRV